MLVCWQFVVISILKGKAKKCKFICLIPVSAHGTNPATAHMANFKVVPVESDKHGNINFKDLSAKCERFSNELACAMITYPVRLFFQKLIKALKLLLFLSYAPIKN
uniref:Uncharacterized protein n=1 Tax=Meloidogyne enterolobii TaxID=390850 RepID=A0A6V7XLT1_MELEN|nr:unnamed protein product [Meloidogyne enterolobii]